MLSNQESLSTKSMQYLTLSVVIITSLIGFSSAAIAKEVKDTQESIKIQNISNPVQDSTRSNWGCGGKRC